MIMVFTAVTTELIAIQPAIFVAEAFSYKAIPPL